MNKEAMKLELDNLISEFSMENSSFAKRVDDIFKEAQAEQTAQPQQEPVAFITPLMEQQMFDDWCPYKGNPDPRVVWAAAVNAVNSLLLGTTPQAQPAQQEPVAHSIVAGALFDFMGWLTSRNECLVLSSTDDAAPAADAIKDFAHMRNLSIDDAKVREWQEHLASSQPAQPSKPWVGLTYEERQACINYRAVEAKLREKNAQPSKPLTDGLPCCGYTDASAIKWNEFNHAVQCHNCGQTYTQTPNKPLTLEYIDQHIGADEGDREAVVALVREVEAAHGIKENT